MKKLVSLLLSFCLVLGCMVFASADGYTPGTYEATAQGYGELKVTVTIDESGIADVAINGENETPTIGGAALDELKKQILDAQSAEIDGVAGATLTTNGVKEAVAAALAEAAGSAPEADDTPVAFTAGTYEGTADGYNGPLKATVTFSDSAITAIEIESSETDQVGTVAFDIMKADMLEANGCGVDIVSGATFSSNALKKAVEAAAEAAGCTNIAAFKKAKVNHEAQEPIEETYDVVVVGAGGAGMAAAAQAAQNGDSVLVIEKNAQVGGNTLVSGGQFQSVMPYLVWDKDNPEATEGEYPGDHKMHEKVKASAGNLDTLRIIANWSEEPFDEEYYKDHDFVAGDDKELSKHGVHAEYLPVLQALKEEINAYLAYADEKMATGVAETDLTLFSTINLHIFQTYYGGLRQTADKTKWIYGDIDLVKQFIEDGQDLKPWLEAQGAQFLHTQPTLIGALWNRENEYPSPPKGQESNWTTYFVGPMATITKDAGNKIMTRTTANELIVEDGRVTGVKAKMYDGTEVTAHATKGVVLCTGGFAANIQMVLDNNEYWDEAYLTKSTKTTNRSSQQGDGIIMATDIGADTTGMNFTQLMPISWVDNGNLAFGSGTYACWISPKTGKRFVDEGSERDVLSLAEFENGVVKNGTPGVFIEIFNADQHIPGPPVAQLSKDYYEGRYYKIKCNEEELSELLKNDEFKDVETDAATILATVKAYDEAVMQKINTGSAEFPDVKKQQADRTIGNVEIDENKKCVVETYNLEDTVVAVRLMAPSTHHTMGGLKVDTSRHVLDKDGNIIPGLYAAGEVTGGIHGGNRLGGNAIVEIFVSGRTAANAIDEDNK